MHIFLPVLDSPGEPPESIQSWLGPPWGLVYYLNCQLNVLLSQTTLQHLPLGLEPFWESHSICLRPWSPQFLYCTRLLHSALLHSPELLSGNYRVPQVPQGWVLEDACTPVAESSLLNPDSQTSILRCLTLMSIRHLPETPELCERKRQDWPTSLLASEKG